MTVIFLVVSFMASIIGAICGIGGGVIIKPVLDSLGVMSVSAVSFLSGCTVLSMAIISVFKARNSSIKIDFKIGTPLAVGAAVGGLVGKMLFQSISNMFADADMIGAIQAGCLVIITIGTLIYTIYANKIKTYQVNSIPACVLIGIFLGIMSSFLGIGGGPINLVVLYFFFSMDTKTAAQNSIYIIMFSQAASFLNTVLTQSVPEFDILYLIVMVLGGVLGGMLGSKLNKKITSQVVDKLFMGLMIVIIIINIYNVFRFTL